jgi:hypothetical protein
LGQIDEEGRENVIYYASRSLNKSERNYSTIDRELLAMVYAVDKFRYYLYGQHFTIITDHNPLVYLNNITLTSERLTRWRLKLSEYDFEVKYRKGAQNVNADTLSRIEHTNGDTEAHKEDVIDALFAVTQIEDKIIYSKDGIFESHHDQAKVVCTPCDLKVHNGIASKILQRCDGYKRLLAQKREIGSCSYLKNGSTTFFMFAKQHATDKPSIEALQQCLQSLKEKCKESHVNKLAFPKYGGGMDKVDWNQLKIYINQILVSNGIQCTVYTNQNPLIQNSAEFSIHSNLREMQYEDEELKELIVQME